MSEAKRNECMLDPFVGLTRQHFKTIVADPPWPYKARMKGSMTKGEQRAVPFDEYATMSLPDIAALPVRDIAADGCHLYLWTTQAFLRDACCRDVGLLCRVLHLRTTRHTGGEAAAHWDGVRVEPGQT